MTEQSTSTDGYSIDHLPMDDDQPVFESPWQARAFALAVILSDYDTDEYKWKAFQSRLVDEIEKSDNEGNYSEEIYYEQWLQALERTVLDDEIISAEHLQQRVNEFASGDRDASEFVEGEHEHHHDENHSHHHH